MLGVSFGELLIILLVAILILKPTDLPDILKKIRKIKLELAKLHREFESVTGGPDISDNVNKGTVLDATEIEKAFFLESKPIEENSYQDKNKSKEDA